MRIGVGSSTLRVTFFKHYYSTLKPCCKQKDVPFCLRLSASQSETSFVLVCKKLGNGAYAKFLYHKGKKLLYRIDKDVFRGKVRIGLHWVESTKFNSRYRIADPAYKGGKIVKVPNAKGGKATRTFHHGQAVSKKRTQFHRELFGETHIRPGQCPEWWDIFNFTP